MEHILGAAFFALASYVGILLAGTVSSTPFEDGPPPGEPPIAWIIGCATLIGFFAASPSVSGGRIAIDAIVICSLSAIWCTDVRYGIVPDVFTIAPLALVCGLSLLQHQPWPVLWAFAAFTPFACLAIVSKGRGMGWGDAKLAALGGAVLGVETALLAFAAGALIAAFLAYRQGREKQVIAFAPYLAAAIAAALPLSSLTP